MTITYLLADAPGGTASTGIHEDLPPGLSPAENELGWSMSPAKPARLVASAGQDPVTGRPPSGRRVATPRPPVRTRW